MCWLFASPGELFPGLHSALCPALTGLPCLLQSKALTHQREAPSLPGLGLSLLLLLSAGLGMLRLPLVPHHPCQCADLSIPTPCPPPHIFVNSSIAHMNILHFLQDPNNAFLRYIQREYIEDVYMVICIHIVNLLQKLNLGNSFFPLH